MRYEFKLSAKNKNYLKVSALLSKAEEAVRVSCQSKKLLMTGEPLTIAQRQANKLNQKMHIAVLDLLDEMQNKNYAVLSELEYQEASRVVTTLNIPELEALFQYFKAAAPKMILWERAITNSRINRGEHNSYYDLKIHGVFNGNENVEPQENTMWSPTP